MQIERATMHAEQDDGVGKDGHGCNAQCKRVLRCAATEQRAREQTAGNEIALRSSAKMTIGKGGWVEGCITVPL